MGSVQHARQSQSYRHGIRQSAGLVSQTRCPVLHQAYNKAAKQIYHRKLGADPMETSVYTADTEGESADRSSRLPPDLDNPSPRIPAG